MGISQKDALDCFASDDLIGIGLEADAVRRRLHPEGVVSYAIESVVDCSGGAAGEWEGIFAAVADTVEMGGTGVALKGVAGRGVEGLCGVIGGIAARFAGVRVQLASADEVVNLAAEADLGETIVQLRDAGLASIQDRANGLSEAVWLEVHRAAHAAGMKTTAGMAFGGEQMEERVGFLQAVRALQEETGGFAAFTLMSVPAASGRELDDPTAVEYLKTLAISRMVLDNIEHVQANWEQQGLKVLQMALRFGANDAGSLLGERASASEETVRQIIRDAGFRPVQRDSLYGAMFLG